MAPLVAQVVPIKIKTGTDMYSEWRKQHKHEGRGIPIVYIVRADGETLYAKSGKPKKEVLGQMLTAALGDAGYIMTERDINVIEKVTDDFRKYSESGNVDAAIRSLRKAKKYLDRDGNVASFALSAKSLQVEMDSLLAEAQEQLVATSNNLDAATTDEEIVHAIESFESIRKKYKPIKSLRSSFTDLQSKINSDKTMKSIQTALRTIENAKSAKTDSSKARSIEKLDRLVGESPSESIVTRAKKLLEQLRSK